MCLILISVCFNHKQLNSDMEWKFARTSLRIKYHYEVGSLPPPFNLNIITPAIKYILNICGKCSSCCKRSGLNNDDNNVKYKVRKKRQCRKKKKHFNLFCIISTTHNLAVIFYVQTLIQVVVSSFIEFKTG